MDSKELDKILELHRKWLNDEEGGQCADLWGANLARANLRGANLREADLRGANLTGANLREANLARADLAGANLWGANLTRANLAGADLRGANLENVRINENTAFFSMQCPEEGQFIGFKKCKNDRIVKLLILDDSKRSSATSRKCRASKVKVLEISNIERTKQFEEAISTYDDNFIYEKGEILEIKDFNEDRWNECSTGIHFFITRQEAVNY